MNSAVSQRVPWSARLVVGLAISSATTDRGTDGGVGGVGIAVMELCAYFGVPSISLRLAGGEKPAQARR